MKQIQNLLQGEDIAIQLSIGDACADLLINGINFESEFTEEFTEEFGSNTIILSAVACVLINNIKQSFAPEVSIANNTLSMLLPREHSKAYEKGLLEIELLITYNNSTADLKTVKKVPIGWLKNAHTVSVG
jgi:hypothetical protein